VPKLTPKEISTAVARVAPVLSGRLSACLDASWRGWRWVLELPSDQIAYVAEDDQGWARLCREQKLLELLVEGVSFRVPVIVAVAKAERVQVRRKAPGTAGFPVEAMVFGSSEKTPTAARYRPDSPLTAAGQCLARDLGRAIAEMQRAVSAEEAVTLGFPTCGLPSHHYGAGSRSLRPIQCSVTATSGCTIWP
jgi:hypothetical protein